MRAFFPVLFSIFLTQPLNAWWSIGGDGSTHDIISARAITLVNAAEYPDIARFSDTIRQATAGKDNDGIAHGKDPGHPNGDRFNGGPFQDWWKDTDSSVLTLYKNSKFSGDLNAYFRIGSMAHLVQDQAVPAHAANIYHGIYFNDPYGVDPDDLEMYMGMMDANYLADPFNKPNYFSSPMAAYYDTENPTDSLILDTQRQLLSWMYPADGPITEWRGLKYWNENGLSQYKYTGRAFFPNTDFGSRGWGTIWRAQRDGHVCQIFIN